MKKIRVKGTASDIQLSCYSGVGQNAGKQTRSQSN